MLKPRGAESELRERRKAKGETATLAAWSAELGISEGQLSRIERGLVESMDVRLAVGIERLYGVSIYDLAGTVAPELAEVAG